MMVEMQMTNKILKKTLLSSALGLMLGFQSMQDASATTVSYADATFYGPDYYVQSGDVELSFSLVSYGAYAEANGVSDSGSPYDYGYAWGDIADASTAAASAYAETYTEGYEPYYDSIFASVSTDSSMDSALSGYAASNAYLTYSFTALGSGVLDLLAPYYYELDLSTGAGDCGSVASSGMMSVSLNGASQTSGPHVHSQSSCNGSDFIPERSGEELWLTLSLEDGVTGYVTLYASAFAAYLPDVVALPLPASAGMMLLGLLMLVAVRRRKNGNLIGTAA